MGSSDNDRRIAIYYEHPDWFRPLFAEFDRRGIAYDALRAAEHHFDPRDDAQPYALVFNRMSPSAYLRGGSGAIFYTGQYLAHLERLGTRVVNGSNAWRTEISKSYQLTLLEQLGLPYPAARVIHDPAHAPAAAEGLRFPVVVKPNVGGSGAGVRRFDDAASLEQAARAGSIDLGIDGTALVQEFIAAEDGRIVRVEVLGGRFLYAIGVHAPGDSFNLCPADACQSVDGAELARSACAVDAPRNGLRVEAYDPSREVIDAVERIARAAGIEIGGVEYMIDERDGTLYYYDVNALSNFVADAVRVIGFDPFVRLVDWLEAEATSAAALADSITTPVEPLVVASHGTSHGTSLTPSHAHSHADSRTVEVAP